MARVRSRNTQPELRLRRELWHRGFRYRLKSNLPGTPDLVLPKFKVAIFVDGCFWHGCPKHYRAPVTNVEFWTRKYQINIARDRHVDGKLVGQGWKVLRFWEHQISQDIEKVIAHILRTCQPL
jgi:DNA mismatch endonuclease (patch repair protein)